MKKSAIFKLRNKFFYSLVGQLFLFFIFLFNFQMIQAATFSVTAVSNASFVELAATTSGTLGTSGTSTTEVSAVYGGKAGDCTNPSPNSTCDTCAEPLTVHSCNRTSVHPALQMGITIKNNSSVAYNNFKYEIRIGTSLNGSTQLNPINSRFTLAQGNSTTLTVLWSAMCMADGQIGNSNCAAGAGNNFETQQKIWIGVDENGDELIDPGSLTEYESFNIFYNVIDTNDAATNMQMFQSGDSCTLSQNGLCGFNLDTPGDEKLNILDLTSNGIPPSNISGYPDWAGVAFVYHQQASGPPGTPLTLNAAIDAPPVIRLFDANYGLSSPFIDGLQNYELYCVAMGNINKAQNIFLFDVDGTQPVASVCGTPSEVVGLLDDKHCFISTAAFGSDMSTEVKTFREFRNQFLVENKLGRLFIKAYYKYSPPMAKFISQSESLRFLARSLLYPLYFFALFSLQWGFLVTLLTMLVLLILSRKIKKDFLTKIIPVIILAVILSPKVQAQVFTDAHQENHAGKADGLIRIDKDGNYIYKHKPIGSNETSHLRVGTVSNPDISVEICQYNNATNCQDVTFNDIYQGASGLGIEYDYEYFLFRNHATNFGKIGLQGGFAINYAKGHGRLVSDPTKESIEEFTFITMPIFFGAVYRFEYNDRQTFVPYVSGGGVYTVLAEKRDDRSKVNAIGGAGFYGSGGGLLNLSSLDRDLGNEFEAEYDVTNLWLSLEYKYISVVSPVFKLQNGYVQAGMGFDF